MTIEGDKLHEGCKNARVASKLHSTMEGAARNSSIKTGRAASMKAVVWLVGWLVGWLLLLLFVDSCARVSFQTQGRV